MDNSVFEKLSPVELMALCIWAEARGQGLEGMQAVGSVILNRAARPGWWGKDIKSVILAPKQFSWLNADDPQRERAGLMARNFAMSMEANRELRACFWIARGLIDKYIGSNVSVATHYHTTGVDPKWDDNMKLVAKIRDHEFFI